MKNIFLALTLFIFTQVAFGQAGPGAIFQGPNILQLKSNIKFKDSNVLILTNDTDNPAVVAKNAVQGSLYIRSGTGVLYQKLDNGLSTNWQPLLIGPAGSGTDECVARWDGTGSPTLQNSLLCITDAGIATGLTQLDLENLRIDGNTVSSTSGDLVFDPFSGNINLPDTTASRPLKVDASKNIVSSQIDLSSSNDISNILTEANGGTGADLSAAGTGSVFYQNAGVMAALAAGVSGQLLKANGAAAPSWIDNKFLSYNNITVVASQAGTTTTYATIQDAFDAIPAATNSTEARQVYIVVIPSGAYDEDVTININNRKIVVVTIGSVSIGLMTGPSWGTGGTVRNLSIFNDGSVATIDSIRSGIAFTSLNPNTDGNSTHQSYLSKFRISGDLDISSTIGITTEFYFEGEVFGNLTCGSYVGNLNSYVKNSRFRGTFGCANIRLQAAINSRFDGLLTTNVYSLIDNSLIGAGMTVTSGTPDLNPSGITRTYFAGTFTGPASSLRLDDLTDYWFTANAASLGGGATKSYLEGVRPVSTGGTGASTLTANNVILGNGTNAVQFVAPGTSGNVLTSNGTTWISSAAGASGVTTVGVIDSQAKSANGLVISGTNIYAQTADATFPGLISTSTQTLAGDKTLSGTTNLSALTASLPLQLDASKNIISSAISLSGTGVSGVLPLASGGTNKNMTASNGAFVYSDADSFEFSTVGTAGQPVLSGGAGAPTYFSSTGVVKATAGVLSTSNVNLTSEVTSVLPLANGGSNKNMTASNGSLVYSDADSFEFSGVCNSGQVWISGGAGAPTCYAPTATRVLYAGTGGILADDAGMTYASANDELTVGTIANNSTTRAAQECPQQTTAQRTTTGGTLGAGDKGKCVTDTDINAEYRWNGTAWDIVSVNTTNLTFEGTWTNNTNCDIALGTSVDANFVNVSDPDCSVTAEQIDEIGCTMISSGDIGVTCTGFTTGTYEACWEFNQNLDMAGTTGSIHFRTAFCSGSSACAATGDDYTGDIQESYNQPVYKEFSGCSNVVTSKSGTVTFNLQKKILSTGSGISTNQLKNNVTGRNIRVWVTKKR